jgi:hypothetical protein
MPVRIRLLLPKGDTMLCIGQRVRIPHPSSFLKLRRDTGTIIDQDPRYPKYWIVRLDEPCVYHTAKESFDLMEIVEADDNLEELPLVVMTMNELLEIGPETY